MLQKPVFSKEDFIQFVMDHVRKADPDLLFHQNPEDDLQFAVKRNNSTAHGLLNLHNLWENYSRVGDLNVIIHFLNQQLKAAAYVEQSENGPIAVDPSRIYPMIRPGKMAEEQNISGLLTGKRLGGGLETIFAENHSGYYVFLTSDFFENGAITESAEKIKARAFDNLRAKGWNESRMRIPALDTYRQGSFQIYEKTDYPFQHQFLLNDMVKGHLPESFLLAIPAKNIAVVYTSSAKMNSYMTARKLMTQSGFDRFVRYCYEGEPGPLSPHIYWVHEQGCHWILRP